MACIKLGSKSDVFHLDGQSWFCSTGLPSDVTVEIGDTTFHLHKFPLLSRSGLLESLIAESSESKKCVLQLDDVPGGPRAFLIAAKFCYGVKVELTASNVAAVRCAAEHLRMGEDYGEANLSALSEAFLNEIFTGWTDSLRVLESCQDVLAPAEDLHLVSRCLNSLAIKACADPTLFTWPLEEPGGGAGFWNGISTNTQANPGGEDWWFEDVSLLKLPLYKRLILAVESRGIKPETVSGSLIHYAKRNLCLLGRDSSGKGPTLSSSLADGEQRSLLEEIAALLPDQKGVTPTNFLLRLMRTAMALQASPACLDALERRVGAQLDQAALEDLLIPSLGYSSETLYDVDCVQRILDHFMIVDRDTSDSTSNSVLDEGQVMGGSHSITPVTMVANLMDNYLAEIAPDPNLKLMKFQSLAAVIPEYARPLDDGIYRAVDIYLKAHPWLTDSEREQICRLVNCQKLSLEASTHAAQNERLPLRVIVQVLFFEQLRLRTSVAGWFFVSDSLDTLPNHHNSESLALAGPTQAVPAAAPRNHQIVAVDTMRDRVSVLEKECLSMKDELEKIVKTKGSWNMFFRRFGFRPKSKPCDKACNNAKDQPLVNGK